MLGRPYHTRLVQSTRNYLISKYLQGTKCFQRLTCSLNRGPLPIICCFELPVPNDNHFVYIGDSCAFLGLNRCQCLTSMQPSSYSVSRRYLNVLGLSSAKDSASNVVHHSCMLGSLQFSVGCGKRCENTTTVSKLLQIFCTRAERTLLLHHGHSCRMLL